MQPHCGRTRVDEAGRNTKSGFDKRSATHLDDKDMGLEEGRKSPKQYWEGGWDKDVKEWGLGYKSDMSQQSISSKAADEQGLHAPLGQTQY